MPLDEHNLLIAIVKTKPSTLVKPREFFISWSGVPTLAYQGFSPVLLGIKQEIEESFPGLKPEKPGSKWPKTTLGALRDGRVLSLKEARILRSICSDLRSEIAAEAPLPISRLTLVVFQCRGLERRLLTYPIPLRPASATSFEHEPPDDHLKVIEATMDQFREAKLATYLPRIQAGGNRESHFRKLHMGVTLVFDLEDHQLKPIERFIQAVDTKLPNAYCWFTPQSRHMTVRSLI